MIPYMSNKDKIRFLMQYRKLILEYDCIVNSYNVLRHKLMFPGVEAQKINDMPKSQGVSNPTEANFIRLQGLEHMIRQRQDMILETLQKIEQAIGSLSDSMQRTILGLRYIDGLVWEKICVEINYEWAHTHRYHSEALKNIEIK